MGNMISMMGLDVSDGFSLRVMFQFHYMANGCAGSFGSAFRHQGSQ